MCPRARARSGGPNPPPSPLEEGGRSRRRMLDALPADLVSLSVHASCVLAVSRTCRALRETMRDRANAIADLLAHEAPLHFRRIPWEWMAWFGQSRVDLLCSGLRHGILTGLESIHVSGESDSQCSYLASLLATDACPRLNSLKVSGTTMTSRGVASLLDAIPGLSDLAVVNSQPLDPELFSGGWISSLSLRNCMNPVGAASLLESPPLLSALTTLVLNGTCVGDPCLVRAARAWSRAPLRCLSTLSLASVCIGDEGVRALVACDGLPELVDLDVSDNQIHDAGMTCLCDFIRTTPRVERICAYDNPGDTWTLFLMAYAYDVDLYLAATTCLAARDDARVLAHRIWRRRLEEEEGEVRLPAVPLRRRRGGGGGGGGPAAPPSRGGGRRKWDAPRRTHGPARQPQRRERQATALIGTRLARPSLPGCLTKDDGTKEVRPVGWTSLSSLMVGAGRRPLSRCIKYDGRGNGNGANGSSSQGRLDTLCVGDP